MKIMNKITTFLMAIVLFSLSVICIFGEKAEYSESERRKLAEFPEVTVKAILSGDFAEDFEEYATDRFPKRDMWRSIKAYTRLNIFMQKDNNGIYKKDGYLSKLEYPMNTEMADHAIRLFNKINEKYLTDNKAYFAMIPDKNCYLADLKLNYKEFSDYMSNGLDFAHNIELFDMLKAENYYKTDTHWKQESITDIADKIAQTMGAEISGEYEKVTLKTPFNGVYVGQSALRVKPDSITYLTNPTIEGFKVEGAKAVYDMEKANSRDPYEMFLSGNQPIITIDNPNNTSGKRLIIFRDSFGSSIAPLLAQGYSQTVLVDLRYISSDMLGQFLSFENADVLFLYSTLLLNNSLSMR